MHALVAPAQTVGYTLHGNRYLNITNRCTLRCAFCPKFNHSWSVQDYALRLHHEPAPGEIVAAVGDPRAFREVVFCGLGEPTARFQVLLDVAEWVQQRGGRVRVNTDGLANLRCGADVTGALAGRVDALSVSLNAQDAAVYDRHCRPRVKGSYDALLDFVRLARAHVPEINLTAVDGLAGVYIAACAEIARALGVGFRRRVLDAVG